MKQTLLVGSPLGSATGGSDPSDIAERRKNKRFTVSASVELLEPQTSTRLNGRVSDVGMGGCYVDTVSPFPIGTSLLIKLVSGKHSVAAKAAVVYAQVGMGMGLVFTEISADHRERLSAWLRELNGEPCEAHPTQVDTPKPSVSCGTAEPAGLVQALQDLVSLLGNRGVLSKSEVEVLREKMGK